MNKSRLFVMALTVVIGLSWATGTLAKYPEKPITYVICFNPGGESDITARIQQKPLGKVLGVPVVMVYNKSSTSKMVRIRYNMLKLHNILIFKPFFYCEHGAII